ncbi:MAG: hypothetical protein CMP21_02975 [Rickettsiales bacterium]|nr:hypothetical protein [Rickettsiales bacterium]|tara:strand:+ start:17024 stop:18187 length:1164 start_codon:yes stop_codon:yes gene_type:complete
MKFTFRYLLYTLVLIGFVTFTFTLCSKAVVFPILDKEPAQESIVYQKTHEARIKANIERFLEKLLGKRLFVVSVVTLLNDSVTDEVMLEKTPEVVSSNRTFTTTSNFNEKAVSYARLRPSSEDIREQVKNTDNMDFSYDSLTAPVIDLPGFPVLEKKKEVIQEKAISTIPTQNLDNSLEPNRTLELENSESNEEFTYLVNQTLKTKTEKKQSIKSINVSIVIDKDYSDYMGMDLAELKTILTTVSGIDAERGDQIAITFAPFMGKEFGWKYFVKKNQVYFDLVKKMYEKVKPIVIAIIMLIVALGVLFLFYKIWVRLAEARQKRKLEKEAQKEKEEQEKAQQELEEKISEMEQKRQELIQLAQTQPDQFILLLNSWMEVDELEPVNK